MTIASPQQTVIFSALWLVARFLASAISRTFFAYEVGFGLWLLIMGVRTPAAHPQTTTSGE